MRRAASIALVPPLFAALLTAAEEARAIEIEDVLGEPMGVDITNTAVFNYRFNNRNYKTGNVGTLSDDNYGEHLDRLNVQVGYWRLRLGLRLDVGTYIDPTSRFDAHEIAKQEVGADADWGDREQFADQVRREANTRFLNTIYPAKLWIDYTHPGLQVTVGDFYAQLGRGLVFSVRKIDELAVDTTVRGGKVVFDHDFGPFRVGATALAGQMNPIRVDEQSGRRLHGDGSPLFFGFPTANDLQTFEYVGFGTPQRKVVPGRPSYLEDAVFAGRVEAGPSFMQLAVNGSMLLRKSYAEEYLQCVNVLEGLDDDATPRRGITTALSGIGLPLEETEHAEGRLKDACGARFPDFGGSGLPARTRDTIRTFSGSLNIPSIAKHGDIYVEVAGQQLRDGHLTDIDETTGEEERVKDLSGYAIYASANARYGPLALSLEGKHYRRFFPLSGNISNLAPGFDAPEFEIVSYSQPPTVEPIYVQPLGAPNICITGGRGRVDFRFARDLAVYGWVGRYVSYSEIDARNEECETTPEKQTNTWDIAAGSELDFEGGKSHARTWAGIRQTTREVPAISGIEDELGLTDSFYQEGYVRYDVVKHLTGPFSLQFQGFHRRRYEPATEDNVWYEGENYTALQWSPHISAIFGYEYLTRKGCDDEGSEVCHYVSGGFQWKSGSSEKVWQQLIDTVTVFVGQRRGAVRCVSGVCRQFPPFEGAKLEIVSRF